jgi:hypothetical protein
MRIRPRFNSQIVIKENRRVIMSTSLADYYERVSSGVVSKASAYAKTYDEDRAHEKRSQLRFIADATSGARALDGLVQNAVSTRRAVENLEITSRILMTALYGLQCKLGLLATVSGEEFEPVMEDPQMSQATTEARLADAIALAMSARRFISGHTASVQLALQTNRRAKHSIDKAEASLVQDAALPSILSSIDANSYYDQAVEEEKALVL